MADQSRKQSLTAELDTARARLGGYVAALRHDVNVGARLKSGVARNPVAWFGAAAILGLLLSKIPPLRRKVVVKGPALRNDQVERAGKAAVALTALKFALSFAKPAFTALVTRQLFGRRNMPK